MSHDPEVTTLYSNRVCVFSLSIVMKSLTSTQDYWQVDRINSELKMHTLQEELERMTLEKNRLQGHCGVRLCGYRTRVFHSQRVC